MCLLNAEKESCAPNSHLSVAGKEFGAQNSYLSSAEREFVAPNSYLSNADKEFCAPNLYLLSAEKEFVAPNSYLSNAGKEFVAPNSCLLTAERKFCAPNAHLSGYESPSATALRGLGAAAPSGAGEGGRFGGRKPPLPSRGGSSLQEFARFQAGRYPTARKKPPNFAALTRGKPRGFSAKGKPLEMFEDTVRACVLCSVFCVLCSVFCVLCSVFCVQLWGRHCACQGVLRKKDVFLFRLPPLRVSWEKCNGLAGVCQCVGQVVCCKVCLPRR